MKTKRHYQPADIGSLKILGSFVEFIEQVWTKYRKDIIEPFLNQKRIALARKLGIPFEGKSGEEVPPELRPVFWQDGEIPALNPYINTHPKI